MLNENAIKKLTNSVKGLGVELENMKASLIAALRKENVNGMKRFKEICDQCSRFDPMTSIHIEWTPEGMKYRGSLCWECVFECPMFLEHCVMAWSSDNVE